MKTAIICFHEIYGVNTFIRTICQKLNDIFSLSVYTPSFLPNNKTYHYSQNDLAYAYFMDRVGFNQATKQMEIFLHNLENEYDRFLLWGYSIGATVGWRISYRNEKVKGFVGFYGSRIRNYMEESPSCPTLLIYPEKEQSFDVNKFCIQLKKAKNIQISLSAASHGFADAYNPVYQEKQAKTETNKAIDFFTKLIGNEV